MDTLREDRKKVGLLLELGIRRFLSDPNNAVLYLAFPLILGS
jgi:hypothetical protein